MFSLTSLSDSSATLIVLHSGEGAIEGHSVGNRELTEICIEDHRGFLRGGQRRLKLGSARLRVGSGIGWRQGSVQWDTSQLAIHAKQG
jgi:hypothetical protein